MPESTPQNQPSLDDIYKEHIAPDISLWRNPRDPLMAGVLKERTALFGKHPGLLSGYVTVPDRTEGDLSPEKTTVLIAALKAGGEQLAQEILTRPEVKKDFLDLREYHDGKANGSTALYYAAKNGMAELAADLLRKGASPENLNKPPEEAAETPLGQKKQAPENILYLAAAHPELLKNASFREQINALRKNAPLWERLTQDNIGILHRAATPEAMTFLVRELGISPNATQLGRLLISRLSADARQLWEEYPIAHSKAGEEFHGHMLRLLERAATALELGADADYSTWSSYGENDNLVQRAKNDARKSIVPGERYSEAEAEAIHNRYTALEARFNAVFDRREQVIVRERIHSLEKTKISPEDNEQEKDRKERARYFTLNSKGLTKRSPLATAIMQRDWDSAATLVAEGASLGNLCSETTEFSLECKHSALTLLAQNYDEKLPGSRLALELKKRLDKETPQPPVETGGVIRIQATLGEATDLLFSRDVMRHVRGDAERLKFFHGLHPDFGKEHKPLFPAATEERVSAFVHGLPLKTSSLRLLDAALRQKLLPPVKNIELNDIMLTMDKREMLQAPGQDMIEPRRAVVDWLLKEATRLNAPEEMMDDLVTKSITAALNSGDYSTLEMIGTHIATHPALKDGAFGRRTREVSESDSYDTLPGAALRESLRLGNEEPLLALRRIGVPCPLNGRQLSTINERICTGAIPEKFGLSLIATMRKDGVRLAPTDNKNWLPAMEEILSQGDMAGLKRLIALDLVTDTAENLETMIGYAKNTHYELRLTEKETLAGLAAGGAVALPAAAQQEAARKEIIQLLEVYKERFKQVEKFGAPLSAAPATLDGAFATRQHLPPPSVATKGLPLPRA